MKFVITVKGISASTQGFRSVPGVDETLTSIWSHRTPFNRTPAGLRFAGKSGTRIFLFRAHPGSDRRVSWRRYKGLLALLGYQFSSHPFHHFLEAAGLSIADGGTLIDVHVHTATHFKSY